jgi:hypothetical protein
VRKSENRGKGRDWDRGISGEMDALAESKILPPLLLYDGFCCPATFYLYLNTLVGY